MPTPTYLANTTSSYSGNVGASSHTLTITKPTGTSIGDCLVLMIAGREDDGTSRSLSAEPTLSNFSISDRVQQSLAYNSSGTARGWVYEKIITSPDEPSSYNFTVTYSGTGFLNMAAVATRFSGVDPEYSTDASSIFDGQTTSTTVTFTNVTTNTANTMLVMCGFVRRDLTTTFVDGTKIADAKVTGVAAAGGGTTAFMGYLTQAAAGASGSKTATISGGTARENDGMILALRYTMGNSVIFGVGSNNIMYANSSNVSVYGAALGNGSYSKIVSGNNEVLMLDYVANSVQPYFTSPSMQSIFDSGIKFSTTANLKLLDAQSNVIAYKIITISPQAGNSIHDVVDVSEASNTGTLYYGKSPEIAIGDQIVYSSNTSNSHEVTIDSQGYISINSSSDSNDSFTYRIWDSSNEIWGDSGTYTFIGANATAVYISTKIKMYIRVV